MTYGSSLGISETSQCNTCQAGLNLVSVLDTKEVMCADCADTQYVNLIVKAHLTNDEAYDYYYKHVYLQIGDNTKARVDIPYSNLRLGRREKTALYRRRRRERSRLGWLCNQNIGANQTIQSQSKDDRRYHS
jgi:hypothetical protein